MLRPLILVLLAPIATLAGDPDGSATVPPGLAERAWAITDAVLARSIDPPPRQVMLLVGLKALRNAGGMTAPPALAREVSAVTTADQFAVILGKFWPAPGPSASVGQLRSALIDGMLSVVPGDAELISGKDLRVAEQVEGNLYVGIQIALGYDDAAKLPVIATVLQGGPADKAGAKDGDIIEAVEGVEMVGLPLKEIVDRLRGPRGSEVSLRLRRPGVAEPMARTMTRDVLPRKTVEGLRKRPGGGWDVRLDGPSAIGYLKLKEIVGSTPSELAEWSRQLEAEGLRALVLDLRERSHSNLHAAILLADALLDRGTIGRIRSADSVEIIRAEPDALFAGWPLAILVGDKMSAETRWLVAALEDNKRAAIVGVPNGPDLEVRSAVPLPGGEWSVMMATGLLERVDGRPFPASSKDARRHGMGSPAVDLNYASPGSSTAVNLATPGPLVRRPADPLVEANKILSRQLMEASFEDRSGPDR